MRTKQSLKSSIAKYLKHFEHNVSDYDLELLTNELFEHKSEVIKLTLKNYMAKGTMKSGKVQIITKPLGLWSGNEAENQKNGRCKLYSYRGNVI